MAGIWVSSMVGKWALPGSKSRFSATFRWVSLHLTHENHMETLRRPRPLHADDKHHRDGRRRPTGPSRPQRPIASPHARRRRRRLWGHWHLAALRDEGKLYRAAPDGGRPIAHLRGHLA